MVRAPGRVPTALVLFAAGLLAEMVGLVLAARAP
jgi:hypothetical protein